MVGAFSVGLYLAAHEDGRLIVRSPSMWRRVAVRIAVIAGAFSVGLSLAARAQDVQVNLPDNNAPNLGNHTTESETSVARSGPLTVVGYNTYRQVGLLGAGAYTSLSKQPIKQILLDTQAYWDHERTPAHVRENFLRIIKCGTIALGAEVFASETESKLVFHTCKSRFCTSCGQRATEAWQADMEAILPDVPYVGITLTLPIEFRPIVQQNRHILDGIPAMGAEAIQQWAKARYGVRLIVLVVQQTFGGFLNFVPHLHVLVSAGGLMESRNRWIHRLKYNERELMCAWRFAVVAFLSEARKRNLLKSSLSGEELLNMLMTQYERPWNVFISRNGSKTYRLKHDGRYIRRPPIAQHRLMRVGNAQVEYLAKDTKNKQFVPKRYANEEFVNLLMQHVPHRGRHAMRYFGLLSPRAKAQLWAGIFVLLNQQRRPHPRRLCWRWLLLKTFGIDPLQDSLGRVMHRIGRRAPVTAA